MNILTQTAVTQAKVEGDHVLLSLETKGKAAEPLRCDQVLVAIGRKPCLKDLGLEALGVALNARSQVIVDEKFCTNIPSIYAIGDIIPGPMLAHKAEEEGIAAIEGLAGKGGHVNHAVIPSVVYTAPELASVGLSEEALKEKKHKYQIGRFLFRANGRAKSLAEEEGMVKILADSDTDRILGVHIVGPRASEMIAEAVLAMEFNASAEDLARTIHAHPTLSEVLKEAALAVDKRSIHA